MRSKKRIIAMVSTVMLVVGLLFTGCTNQQEGQLNEGTKDEYKVIGLNNQSTKIKADEQHLSAPTQHKVMELDNVSIDESAPEDKNTVQGMTGVKIE